MARVRRPGEGRTKWSRFGLATAVGLGAVTVLGVGIAQGVVPLPLNIGLSGIPFQLSATKLSADGFAQYAYPDELGPSARNAQLRGLIGALAASKVGAASPITNTVTKGDPVTQVWVSDTITQLNTNIKIEGLNQTICAPVPSLGDLGINTAIKVHILGSGTTTATNMTIQAPALNASSASFENFSIGGTVAANLAAAGISSSPYSDDPAAMASLGQSAKTVTLNDVNQVGLGTEAATFNLGGLKVWAEFVSPTACLTQ
jgi:hypothetical protein